MSDQKSWFPSEGADNAVTTGDPGAVSSPPSRGRIGRLCGRIWRGGGDKAAPIGVFSGVLAASLLLAPGTASAKPCEKHTRYTKVTKAQCVKAHRAQVKRDRMAWPPNPTWREIEKRARPGELAALRKIAQCEQPGSGRHGWGRKYGPRGWRTAWGINAGNTYQGAYGMYRSTYGIGASVTGYDRPPNATPAEETGVAMVVARRFGYSAWGCW